MGSNGFGNGLAQHSGTGTNNGGRIESVSSTATSPANTVEENGGDYATRSPKRRRKVD
jgi:heat shock transcription factor